MQELTELYKSEIGKYQSCCSKIQALIEELLISENVKYHKIEARVKSADSLDEKIINKNNKYSFLSDITDIVGFRIITYFEDEVDKVAEVFDKEFKIDIENSCDKRNLNINTFGYRSLHYVANLNDKRGNLKEYLRFKDIKFEIQIRSILQHAWAEIEHDLGYKGVSTVPDSFKRKFSMIAALLEMADRDFVMLRDESHKYKTEIVDIIESKPEEVDINANSLQSYINSSTIIIDINMYLNNLGIKFNNSKEDGLIHMYLKTLDFLNIKTIANLNQSLIKYRENILSFIGDWFNQGIVKGENMVKGASIIYLGYILAKKNNKLDNYLSYLSIRDNDKLKYIKEALNKLNL